MSRPGHVWSILVQNIRTPYTFVAMDMDSFGHDIDFERMVKANLSVAYFF